MQLLITEHRVIKIDADLFCYSHIMEDLVEEHQADSHSHLGVPVGGMSWIHSRMRVGSVEILARG